MLARPDRCREDDAVAFRERLNGRFIRVVADHDDVRPVEHLVENILILLTRPVRKMACIKGYFAVYRDGGYGNATHTAIVARIASRSSKKGGIAFAGCTR